ncbi:oxidoreductase [Streptomyces sp. NBC_01216]|uniref:oxidoreductase n=1 Tax=unclassified Streptomyces TaxID=2593676 RepID=UPI002E0D3D6E|nr:oxidoreductase [Streptomyces sp. NBC_01216]
MTYHSGPYGYGQPPPPPPKPGVIPLAPLRFGEILTGAFTVFGRYWKPLLGIALAAFSGALLIAGAAVGVAWATVGDHLPGIFDLPDGQSPSWDDGRPLLIAFGCVWLVTMIVMYLATGVVYAACPAVLQEAVLGRPAPFGLIWHRAWSRMPAVLGTVFLTMLLMLIPAALFLLGVVGLMVALIATATDSGGPSFALPLVGLLILLAILPLTAWLWVKLSLAPTAAVVEGQGAVAALRRSWHLVTGSWWRVFGALVAAAFIASAVNFALQQVFGAVAAAPTAFPVDGSEPQSPAEVLALIGPGLVIAMIGSLVGQIVSSVFPPLVTGLVYVDQRFRKEGFAPTLAQAAGVAPYGV